MMARRSTIASFGTIGVALVAAFAPTPAPSVERLFSGSVYPLLQPALTRLSNRVPFALFDALIAVVAVLMLVWFVSACANPRTHLWRFVVRTATMAAALYLIFLAVWGLNYRREPLRRTVDFHEERVTRAALQQLAERTVTELNAIHPRLSGTWPGWSELRFHLTPAFDKSSSAIGARWRVEPGNPKRSFLNIYFKRTAVDGMIDPFFLEVLVNQDVLPFERPFIVAHEWGHLAGRADESEASFLGWMACMHGPVWARYSAWLSLYGTIVAGLPADRREAVGRTLTAGPRRDLVALSERIARQSSAVARRVGEAAYDRFLKANRLPEGVASYGLVVTLLLGARVEIPSLDSRFE